jgi:hypothetical protein
VTRAIVWVRVLVLWVLMLFFRPGFVPGLDAFPY